MFRELVAQFALDEKQVRESERLSMGPEFERVNALYKTLESELLFDVSRAPVLADLPGVQASLERREKTVVLNGHFLDRCADPKLAEKFLRAHEIFHYYCLIHGLPEALGISEEEAADLFALAHLRKELAQ